ncbi:unnamed protein product [Symbiodinium pilosum]|uniref:Uncharacterized protein n=1 Tax=Symbiodinium pilosum TaxID=2952 RepID=A0A812YEQ7_SYMPI|nr:unnamed protein product [Symbiodinium pilosum]
MAQNSSFHFPVKQKNPPGKDDAPLNACTVEERRPSGSILEEWFVEPTSDFELWRSRGSNSVNIRCQAAKRKAEEVHCLECVSHIPDLLFAPWTSDGDATLLPSERRRRATLELLASVMQARLISPWRNGSMKLCRRAVGDKAAFCKAAAVTVPA